MLRACQRALIKPGGGDLWIERVKNQRATPLEENKTKCRFVHPQGAIGVISRLGRRDPAGNHLPNQGCYSLTRVPTGSPHNAFLNAPGSHRFKTRMGI